MDVPRFYHFAKASGLVTETMLNEILVDLRSPSAIAAPPVSAIGLERFQRPARLKDGTARFVSDAQTDTASADSGDTSLDGESVTRMHEKITMEDRRLADELVRRGLLNAWQTAQLLDGRTKFSLGDYRILDAVGRGGYGHVFLAWGDHDVRRERENSSTILFAENELYAIKVLPQVRATPELTARFLHEIDVQKGLSHPNLVRFVDSGRDGNVHYMVHEFVDGGDMRRLIHNEGRLPFDVAATIVFNIAKGIHYLHEKGLVHRDVKPANILLCSEGLAKLVDMGLTVPSRQGLSHHEHVLPDESGVIERQIDKAIGLSGKIAGTVDFLAPDQVRFPDEPVPAWDIYSLGCLFYLALTGNVPFPKGDVQQKIRAHLQVEAADPRVFEQSIPFDIARLLRTMLAKDPSRRIQTAWEVAERLRAWIPPYGLAGKLRFDDGSPFVFSDEEVIGFRRPRR